MQVLVSDIRGWFERKRKHLLAFAEFDCRLEGWFKGELLVLFNRMQAAHRIAKVEREVKVPRCDTATRTQVDFAVTIGKKKHLCELKSLCISHRATPRNLQFYFRDDDVGLIRDFRKLDYVQAERKWGLAFVYPTPAPDVWAKAVESLLPKLPHWESLSDPRDAKDFLFVSLWRCKKSI
jgi:hypothetical protein